MYQHQSSAPLTAIFVAAGVVLLAAGLFLYRKYRDDRPQDQKNFKDFGVGSRGALAYGGIVLMLLGASSCAVGLFLPAILH